MSTLKWLVFLSVCIGSMLAGCATQKAWIPYSGSKSDGVVKLAYEYGGFEKPVIPEGQAQQAASERCRVWGYSGAEPFGGVLRQCTASNQYGCVRYRVLTEFQCTGKE
jgi:hypothetical protein